MTKDGKAFAFHGIPHWFQSSVFFLLFGLLAIWLLGALVRVKEAAERQAVEMTIRNIRTGMQLAALEALVRQSGGEMSGWVGDNPVRWLAGTPQDYVGDCSAQEVRNLRASEWCFDRENRELVYKPSDPRHLRPLHGDVGCENLRWRVSSASKEQTGRGVVDIRLEEASGCQWVLD